MAFAGIAADSQVEYGSAGERKEGRDACQRKTKSWLLLRRLRIGLLVIRGIWHRYRRAVVGQDAAMFPKPLFLGGLIQGLSSFTCYVCKKLLGESFPCLAISAGFR